MLIRSLKLYSFRNLSDVTINLPGGLCCLVGENGQGKTNLIEAISLLSLARSFRTGTLVELARWGSSRFSVFASCSIKGQEEEIGISLDGKKRRTFLQGQENKNATSLIGRLLTVTFSPTDLALILGAPQERRRFIDRHAVELDPKLMEQYLNYQKALRSKGALLKCEKVDYKMIQSWNEILVSCGKSIILGRKRLSNLVCGRLAEASSRFFGDSNAIELEWEGFSAIEEQALGNLQELFDRSIEREIMQQRALVGPHRDDLRVMLLGKDARSFASQGQARSIVLALKLSILRILEDARGESPILLLDDVDSELDHKRREAIFESAIKQDRQVFITGTELRLPNSAMQRVELIFEVRGGELFQKDNKV